MKKFVILAAAVAAIAACTKSQVVYDDNDVEIGLSPVNYMTTKAPVYGIYKTNWYPSTEKFRVFSQYTQDPAGTEWSSVDLQASSTYFSDAVFVARDNELWGGETPYYWPKSGSLFFAGYSPSEIPLSDDSSRPQYTFANSGDGSYLTVPGFVQGNYKYTTGDEFSTFDYPDGYTMVDLMYFDVYSNTQSVNNVEKGHPVLFKHALSWLTFNINCEAGFDGIFTVTKVTLKNISDCATFNSGQGDGSFKRAAWNNHTNKNYGNIVLYDCSTDGSTNNILKNSTHFEIDDVLIIPQSIYNFEASDDPTVEQVLEIAYTMKAHAGDEYNSVAQIPAQVKLSGGDGNGNDQSQWLINKHYTYNITITGTNEILIKPSVDTWSEVNGISVSF